MQFIQAFKALGPLMLDPYIRPKEEERDAKKQRRHQADPDNGQAIKLLRLMGTMILKLDAEQQVLRKQDCWIFYMQNEPHSLLASLVTQAQKWHAEIKELKSKQDYLETFVPLRQHLFKHTVELLKARVQQLANVKDPASDPLWTTSQQHGLILQDGGFPFRRWQPQQQALIPTKKAAIPMQRMLQYMAQLHELTSDPNAVMKYHAMTKTDNQPTIPWLLQISLRQDELQVLLDTLQGSTAWGLVGSALKPHTLMQSKQGQQLQEMLGKGKGKTHSKSSQGKGKNK